MAKWIHKVVSEELRVPALQSGVPPTPSQNVEEEAENVHYLPSALPYCHHAQIELLTMVDCCLILIVLSLLFLLFLFLLSNRRESKLRAPSVAPICSQSEAHFENSNSRCTVSSSSLDNSRDKHFATHARFVAPIASLLNVYTTETASSCTHTKSTAAPLLGPTGDRSMRQIPEHPHFAGRHPAITQVQGQSIGKGSEISTFEPAPKVSELLLGFLLL